MTQHYPYYKRDEVPRDAVHSFVDLKDWFAPLKEIEDMTKNKDTKPQYVSGLDEDKRRSMNLIEFAKYDEVLSAKYEVLRSINVKGYALKVSWKDLLLKRKAMKDRILQMRVEVLGGKESGVMEVWCKFLGFRFNIRHYY